MFTLLIQRRGVGPLASRCVSRWSSIRFLSSGPSNVDSYVDALGQHQQQRISDLANFHATHPSIPQYPLSSSPSQTISSFVEKYAGLEKGDRVRDVTVTLIGRIESVRAHGGLVFLDLKGWDGGVVQVMGSKGEFKGDDGVDMKEMFSTIRRGDVICEFLHLSHRLSKLFAAVTGCPGKSNRGEVTLVASSTNLLAPCLHQLPDANGLINPVSSLPRSSHS